MIFRLSNTIFDFPFDTSPCNPGSFTRSQTRAPLWFLTAVSRKMWARRHFGCTRAGCVTLVSHEGPRARVAASRQAHRGASTMGTVQPTHSNSLSVLLSAEPKSRIDQDRFRPDTLKHGQVSVGVA